MADGETPPGGPDRDDAAAPSQGGPAGGAPEQPTQGLPLPAPEAQGAGSAAHVQQVANGADEAPDAVQSGSPRDSLGQLKHLIGNRKAVWAAVGALCVVGGSVGAVLGARAVARSDSAKARLAFPQTAAGIASTLKLAIQRQEELAVSASTYFAENPRASTVQFQSWARWAQTLRRFPELENLGLVVLVRRSELPSFESLLTGHAPKPSLIGAARIGAAARGIVPPGTRNYYCLAAAELARKGVNGLSGVDYCALTPTLLSSRDSAHRTYTAGSAGQVQLLQVQAPVYRRSVPPSTFARRRGAFVGWLHEVLVPTVVLGEVLQTHPGYAVHLRIASSNVVFTGGTPQPGALTTAVDLHNGWTVRSFGPPAVGAGPSALEDHNALALLIVGILLSILLGVLVFVVGSGRRRTVAPAPEELAHADLYDALTGLPNRALMLDRAERMLARATRQSGLLVGALFIDIDWFKNVNEKLGQAAGDQLLKIVAQRLEDVVRAHDTVGRLGGDEFVVLVESAARGVRLDALARRVIEALHEPVELDGFGLRLSLTASIGVAFGRYETAEDLLRDALLALTSAKAAGRNRYTLFNANMRSVIEGRGQLGAELNVALQGKQFFLLYQPVYDLAAQKVVDIEALIRWQHPTQGVLAPHDFTQLAEESGLIVPIGRWALEEACSRAAEWNVAGHRAGISIKVAPSQVNRSGFTTDVRRALLQSGLEPSFLTLEITEVAVMRDVVAATERLEEIKRLGVRVAIDDFGGTGYTYHSELRQMPLDFLKVDRSSLAASEDQDYRSWLLEAILIVGKDLAIPVIATGVETYEQMRTLQAMGCPLAEGSFLGAPARVEAVESLFEADFPTAPASPSEPVQQAS